MHGPILLEQARDTRQKSTVVSCYGYLRLDGWESRMRPLLTGHSQTSPNPRETNSPVASVRIPCDIVDVHRLNDSCTRIYPSLRYGVFLAAYAPLESFFTQLTRFAEFALLSPLSARLSPLSPVQSVTRTQTPCIPPAQTGAVLQQEMFPHRIVRASAGLPHKALPLILRSGGCQFWAAELK
jgi:hypothetical protein